MSGENPLKPNTTALTDGDFLLSPSITNLYEGMHGNGIILYEDGATSTSGIRRTPASLPGAISASVNTLTIKGGYAIIDGMLVNFGGGYASNAPISYSLELRDSTIEGSNNALTSGQTCLLVVYVCTDGSASNKHILVEMGNPVSSGFPVTPESFLSDAKSSLSSKQSTVLAVLKAEFSTASGGGNNDLDLNITNVYDMRTFLRPAAPLYFTPMTKDVVGTYTNRINNHTLIDGMHGGSDENGSLGIKDTDEDDGKFGAMWVSNNETDESVLYFSGRQGTSRYTWRLGPPKVVTDTNMTGNLTFKVDGGNYFHLTPTGGTRQLNPVGEFPISHTIHVYNYSGSQAITLNGTNDGNSGTSSYSIANGQSIVFTYNGSIWKQSFVSGNTNTAVHGAQYNVQLNDGSGNFTSSNNLAYNTSTNVLTVTGKISTNNLVDGTTGIDFTAVATNPDGANTLWIDSDDSRLYHGSTKVLMTGDSVGATTILGLTDTPQNYTSASGKVVAVNTGNGTNGTALEFRDLVTGDIPSNLSTVTNIGPAGTLTVNQDLTVTGNLTVSGTNTVLNVGTLEVEDKTIELAKNASSQGDDAAANGAGIIVDSSDGGQAFLWNNTTDAWESSEHLVQKTGLSKTVGTSARKWTNGYFTALNSGALTSTTITGSGNLAIDTDTLLVDTANDRVAIEDGSPNVLFQVKKMGMDYLNGSFTGNDASSEGTTIGGVTNCAEVKTLFSTTSKFTNSAKLLVELKNADIGCVECHEIGLAWISTTAKVVVYGTTRTDTGVAASTFGADVSGGNVRLGIKNPVAGNDDAYTYKIGIIGFV